MPMLLGKAKSTFTSFDIQNQDISLNKFKVINRSIDKSISTLESKSKAFIKYDFDFLTDADFRLLTSIARNRSALCPGVITLMEPYSENLSVCDLNFQGVTYPSSTNIIKVTNDNTLISPTSSEWSELSTINYSLISGYDENDYTLSSMTHAKMLLRFDCSPFISAFSMDEIEKFTLVFFGMRSSPILFYVWNECAGSWLLVKTSQYSFASDFTDSTFYPYWMQFIQFGLPFGYESFYNFLSGGKINFLVKFPDNADIYLQYVRMLINGYLCINDKEENFNFRDAYIGTGKKGSLSLLEV